jgi:hypothetical protein
MGAVAGAVMQGDRVRLTEGRYRLRVLAGAPGWVLSAVAPSVFEGDVGAGAVHAPRFECRRPVEVKPRP